MDALTNIYKMIATNKIYVPNYQRSYSWDTQNNDNKQLLHVNTFFSDLTDFIYSNKSIKSKYYFGHFLFEEKGDSRFAIID